MLSPVLHRGGMFLPIFREDTLERLLNQRSLQGQIYDELWSQLLRPLSHRPLLPSMSSWRMHLTMQRIRLL